MKHIYMLILTLILALQPIVVNAEYCDMIGCKGEIYWIFIPQSQIDLESGEKKTISVNGQSFPLDVSHRLFLEKKLPKVNEVVTLNVDVNSTTLPDFLVAGKVDYATNEEWNKFKKIDKEKYVKSDSGYKIDGEELLCAHEQGGKRGCWDLNKGAKLRILNYNQFSGLLFALVYVESD